MKRIYPRIKFSGGQFADTLSTIFAENLEDLLEKVEIDDSNPPFPKGFMHTSTIPHEGTCYYDQAWSRDVGRGVQELARLGFIEEAKLCVDYFLSEVKTRASWGRVINRDGDNYEACGTTHIMNSIYQTWKASGYDKELGTRYIKETESVFGLLKQQMEECPYGYLVPNKSELTGNPSVVLGPVGGVYGIYPNYGVWVVLKGFEKMATVCGVPEKAAYFKEEASKLIDSIMEKLGLHEGLHSFVKEGCWINGINADTGKAYDTADYYVCKFPIHKWTRQLPFIQDYDFEIDEIEGLPAEINRTSYDYILHEMAKGYFFRKYGFVSNTCWEGCGGRHDDTMAGYGQNYMTQATLIADDVNAYTKCFEGIARLGYDGDIIEPLAFEMNPWIMHECFEYENYEQGLDHTFGRNGDDSRGIMHNPGDEGNLVQASETLKSISLIAGLNYMSDRNTLVFKPRMPWEYNEMTLLDYPVFDSEVPNGINRIDVSFNHQRWLRESNLYISAQYPVENIDVRFGPYAHHFSSKLSYALYKSKDEALGLLIIGRVSDYKDDAEFTHVSDCEIIQTKNASWIWARNLKLNSDNELNIQLCL